MPRVGGRLGGGQPRHRSLVQRYNIWNRADCGEGDQLDYRSALKYILGLTNYEKSLKELYSPGNVDLERVRVLLRRLGSPESGLKIVHIAGTKGKGSTAAMISSVLRKAGYRVGLFTSPHLHTFRERIQVDGEPISAEDFAAAIARVKPHVDELNAAGEHGFITTFEALTATALLYFAEKGVEALVFEVGVGGRLDATNVVTPEVSVITSISRDHTELLGETLPEIAGEKAGIVKAGIPVVVAPQRSEAEEVFERIARERGSEMVSVGREVVWHSLEHGEWGQKLLVRDFEKEYRVSMPLLGDHQQENAATAITALSVLRSQGWDISDGDIVDGFVDIRWPGRMEELGRRPLVIADGAHNGDSARRLREALTKYYEFEKVVLVVGVSADKNVEDIAAELVPLASTVILTKSRHMRAAGPDAIAGAFSRPDIIVETTDSVKQALSRAREMASEEDLICVTGSLFVVGEAIEAVKRVPMEIY